MNDDNDSLYYEKNLSLLEQVRRATRLKHYSIRTEKAYVEWIKRFILYHNKKHPKEMGAIEVTQFLSYLAIERNVAPNTQSQAFNAILFLYKYVLKKSLDGVDQFVRPKKKQKLPIVLTQSEIKKILAKLNGKYWLAACLLYGSGLRLMECMRLRVSNIDFEHIALFIHNAKGGKDRIVTLPEQIVVPLKQHLEQVRMIHKKDLADGYGEVYLPHAMARKYPKAASQWGWQYVFPASCRSLDPRTGIERRHHLNEQALQRKIKQAIKLAGIHKPATCHTLRHYAEFRIMLSCFRVSQYISYIRRFIDNLVGIIMVSRKSGLWKQSVSTIW